MRSRNLCVYPSSPSPSCLYAMPPELIVLHWDLYACQNPTITLLISRFTTTVIIHVDIDWLQALDAEA